MRVCLFQSKAKLNTKNDELALWADRKSTELLLHRKPDRTDDLVFHKTFRFEHNLVIELLAVF